MPISCFYHNVHNWALLGGLNSSTTPLITKLSFKITDLKFHPNLKGTNELTHSSQVTLTLWHGLVSQLWFSHLVGVMTAIISTYADSILTRHPGIKFNRIFWEIKIYLFRKMHLALSHASNGNRALRVAPYSFFKHSKCCQGRLLFSLFQYWLQVEHMVYMSAWIMAAMDKVYRSPFLMIIWAIQKETVH